MQSQVPVFTNRHLLETALTHRSALNEQISPSTESNERLEFLGDAVLELATTEFLFQNSPDDQEGTLTAYRSALVRTRSLAEVARTLQLGDQLYMSKGEEASGGRDNESILENTFEALVGALYLDQGFEVTRQFLTEHLFIHFDRIKSEKLHIDAKSYLQELVQARGLEAPSYQVIDEAGPDHDKQFTVEVIIAGKSLGKGEGRSKQLAQQKAARAALHTYDPEFVKTADSTEN